jgi:hypothetical protein
MRVLVDANIFLSYILAPTTPRAVTAVVTACFSRDEIDLVAPPELIAEIAAKAASKRYFRSRVPRAALDRFVAQLTAVSTLLPPVEETQGYSRDPKDDYLVAYGIIHEADYLITGDADLLVLGTVGQLQIVRPSTFLAVLRRQQLLP